MSHIFSGSKDLQKTRKVVILFSINSGEHVQIAELNLAIVRNIPLKAKLENYELQGFHLIMLKVI